MYEPRCGHFNPDATVDDGSPVDTCVLLTLINPYFKSMIRSAGDGMTYANACYAVYFGGLACRPGLRRRRNRASERVPNDINEDGTTNVADLLMVLGEFASECE